MTNLLFCWRQRRSRPRGLAWKETDHSLALVRGGQVVWQFNYQKEQGKPYFHPVTIAGSQPVTDLRPADHFWHKAIWFSWKTINGVLYWDEDPKTGKSPGETEVVEAQAKAARRPFGAVRTVAQLPPAGPTDRAGREADPGSEPHRGDGSVPHRLAEHVHGGRRGRGAGPHADRGRAQRRQLGRLCGIVVASGARRFARGNSRTAKASSKKSRNRPAGSRSAGPRRTAGRRGSSCSTIRTASVIRRRGT